MGRILNRREWRAAALLGSLLCSTSLQAQSSSASEEGPPISVRISVARTHFQPGEDIPLHVEIWNDSEQDLFVYKKIATSPSNALAKIDLTLYCGGRTLRPKWVVISDTFGSGRSTYPPLVSELSRYWIALPPHHFYGGELVMRGSWFDLKKPGKYRIQGRYSSRGFLAQDMNNPLLHYVEELKQLPYRAWDGSVETNSVWIEVTGPQR